ncbi:MAG: delta(1)-pyrroline-2-carboxylate reductase family protein [Proteobacteria bacterium]|nr:delta(1)-pyrroline-2-carboxylate reductase family protein [Pseudomonadota bacterium]
MRTYSAAETAKLLPYPELAEALAGVLRRMARGELTAPARIHSPLPGGGVLLVMPAADEAVAVTKLVTVHPGNPARGLPLIQGEMVVMDAASGERLGILDGPTVTSRRTAALSLLAAQTLAPHEEGPLLVVGAGVQARAHLEAFAHGLGIHRVFCCARSEQSAVALAEFARTLGIEATVATSAAAVLRDCSLVVTATTSNTPVLSEDVTPGTFIAAVGAFTPQAAEIPARLVRACRVVVDTVDTRHEAGDLIQADVDWDGVLLLGDVLNAGLGSDGPAQGQTGNRPVLFKSVGHALFDLAAGRLALGR